MSLFIGLSTSLSIAFLIGIGLPICVYEFSVTGIMMIVIGLFMTIVFIGIAMLAALQTRDKAKGIGITILLWLYFSLLFDGLVLFLLFQFADYPLEKMMVGISALNPIDLGRILILLKMDVSALMGYTGAIFKNFFGTTAGMSVSFVILLLWIYIPVQISLRKFNKKDL